MSFIFNSVDRFVAGTVGQPGERAFFIQARKGARLTTVSLEKAQLSALTQRLEIVLNDLRKADFSLRITALPIDDGPLEVPIESEFEIGAISLSWDQSATTMNIELFELTTEDSEAEASLRVQLDISMCDAFIKRSKSLIHAGRPSCPLCGLPIDPQAHLCPRANGYRR